MTRVAGSAPWIGTSDSKKTATRGLTSERSMTDWRPSCLAFQDRRRSFRRSRSTNFGRRPGDHPRGDLHRRGLRQRDAHVHQRGGALQKIRGGSRPLGKRLSTSAKRAAAGGGGGGGRV